MRSRIADRAGQAAAELLAVLPLALAVALATAQLALAGYGLWSAAEAARAGARAELVGGDGETSALSALPSWLEHGAEVDLGEPVAVEVEVPALLPGAPSIPVSARSSMGEAGG